MCRRSCIDVPVMMIHLITVELRGAAILCVSAWSLLKQVTIRLALSDHKEETFRKTQAACLAMGGATKERGAPTSIQGILTMVNDAVVEYMVSSPFDSDFISHDGLIVGSFDGLLPKLVYLLLAWIVLLLACSSGYVLCHGARDWRSGAYISAVWRLKDSIVMKLFGLCMVALTVVLLGGLLFISVSEPESSDFNPLLASLVSNTSGIVLWMLGLTTFISSGLRPGWKWDHDSFKGLVFDRRPTEFLDTSDVFGRHISYTAWSACMPEDNDPEHRSAGKSACCSAPRALKEIIRQQASDTDVLNVFGFPVPGIQVDPNASPAAPLLGRQDAVGDKA